MIGFWGPTIWASIGFASDLAGYDTSARYCYVLAIILAIFIHGRER